MSTDRDKAMFALFPELANELPHNLARLQFSDESEAQMAAVEALIADERAKARAPFLALAAELDGEHDEIRARMLSEYGVRFRWDIAERIRRAATDPPEVSET